MENKDPLSKINSLYHFTDTRNLPMIRELGGLHTLSYLRKKEINIVAPGSNEVSQNLDSKSGLDRYVHLCFRNNHPMEHIAKTQGRIKDSIFLQVSPAVLQFDGVKFTDGIANKGGVLLRELDEARDIIDFEVLSNHTNWKDPAILQRLQRVEKYEILIPRDIPLSYIWNLPNG